MLALLFAAALAQEPAPPPTPDEAAELADAAVDAGRLGEARRLLDLCEAASPDHAGCRYVEGRAAWALGKAAEAQAAWEEVKRHEPGFPDIDAWIGRAKAKAAVQLAAAEAFAKAPATIAPHHRPARTLRLRAVGDVMLGSDFPEPELPPDDGAHLLDPVAAWLRDADVTFGNLEGPLCDRGATDKCVPGAKTCYAFRTPTRYAPYLATAGFDVLSTANNHAGDFGEICRRETERVLDLHGIAWSGPPGTVATVVRGGVRVGVVAFYSGSGSNALNDHAAAQGLVRAAAAVHDLVVVSFHGGAEGADRAHVPDGPEMFFGENRGDLRAFARAVIAAGADLVIGHGPHVLRGMEVVDGRLVVYSLGNFATYGRFNLTGPNGLAAVLDVTLDADDGRLVEGRVLAGRQPGHGGPVPDPSGKAVAEVVRLTAEDFPTTGPRFARDGRFVPRSP